jgi:hypothetical protein
VLLPGISYRYRVVGVNENGHGKWSADALYTPPP